MTFLATYDGKLEPGYVDGKARMVVRDGVEFYDWPRPWAFRCDGCGRVFPYGCVALRKNERLRPPTVREYSPPGRWIPFEDSGGRWSGDDEGTGQRHRCAYCEGYLEPFEQLSLPIGGTT